MPAADAPGVIRPKPRVPAMVSVTAAVTGRRIPVLISQISCFREEFHVRLFPSAGSGAPFRQAPGHRRGQRTVATWWSPHPHTIGNLRNPPAGDQGRDAPAYGKAEVSVFRVRPSRFPAHPAAVTGAGRRVGCDSPSRSSRECRRRFGALPGRDTARLRDTVLPPAGVLPRAEPSRTEPGRAGPEAVSPRHADGVRPAPGSR
ncbi:hypothetical protein GCM10010421_60220 [Streptomyces glaucus]|uniref:Secreted protein n=1 Tax=Streptomyces glaucus TaxID=284029 RepID=A0ABN3KJ47_9ACTN